MSVLEREGAIPAEFTEDTHARLALDEIEICAGRRCVEAVRLADRIQAANVGAPERVRMLVHQQVGQRCLSCTEGSVEPVGSAYDTAQIEAILAEGRTD